MSDDREAVSYILVRQNGEVYGRGFTDRAAFDIWLATPEGADLREIKPSLDAPQVDDKVSLKTLKVLRRGRAP